MKCLDFEIQSLLKVIHKCTHEYYVKIIKSTLNTNGNRKYLLV